MTPDPTATALDYAFVLGLTWILATQTARALGLPAALGTVITGVGAAVAATGRGPLVATDAARLLFAPANAARCALSGLEAPPWLLDAPQETNHRPNEANEERATA